MSFSPSAVARILGCSKDQVISLIAAGELAAVNIGLGKIRARYKVRQEAIDDFIRRRTTEKLPQRKPRKVITRPTRDWV